MKFLIYLIATCLVLLTLKQGLLLEKPKIQQTAPAYSAAQNSACRPIAATTCPLSSPYILEEDQFSMAAFLAIFLGLLGFLCRESKYSAPVRGIYKPPISLK